MKLDTIGKTLSISSGEKVSSKQLADAAFAMSSAEFTLLAEPELTDWERDLLEAFVPTTNKVESQTTAGRYYHIMNVSPGIYVCTCPHFVHKQVLTGNWCKHISSFLRC